ncbi:MAG: tetratricopeptide repeat protein [Chloroflexi bacterium]|nr:tetratricopeptide repeat protein [Chloroflexota bacterium]
MPEITACGALGYICLKQGDYPLSLEYLEAALKSATTHDNAFHLPLYQLYRAELDLLHGNYDEALDRAEDAFDLAEINQQHIALSEFHVLLAKMHAEQQDWETAVEIMNHGIDMHLLYSRLPFAADAMLSLAHIHAARGEPHAAAPTLDKALRLFQHMHMAVHIGAARQLQMALGALT